jgi:hypothetical protein
MKTENKNILVLRFNGNAVAVTPKVPAIEGLIFLFTIKNKIK